MNQLEKAYAEWRGRESGSRYPESEPGRSIRWYPHERNEWQSCCDKIRRPSRKYPYSLLQHCKSAKHVASLFGVERKDLLAMHKRLTADYKPVEFSTEKDKKKGWVWF